MSDWIVRYVWLTPAIPLVASLIILSLSNTRRMFAAALAIAGQVGALVIALLVSSATLPSPGFRVFQNFTWFTFGEYPLRLGWVVDPLAAAMLVMIRR